MNPSTEAQVQMVTSVCSKHENQKIKYACVDPKCPCDSALCCIFCIKNNHNKCKDEFVVGVNDFKSKLELHLADYDSDKIINALSEVLDSKIILFSKELLTKKSQFLQSLNLSQQSSNFSLETLRASKKNLQITYNRETKKIEIRPKIDINSDNF